MYNCDETGLFWRLMLNKTLVSSREKEAKGFNVPIVRVIIMPCANATESIIFPLLFILKSLNSRCRKNVAQCDFQVDNPPGLLDGFLRFNNLVPRNVCAAMQKPL